MRDEVPYLPDDVDFPFPSPRNIPDDIVAVGGNLSPGMLLSAYRRGIFPWFSENEPILWWSLDPRFVLFPSRVHVSRTLRREIRKKRFTLTVDQRFGEVIRSCRSMPRPGQEGTWITGAMVEAYEELHRLGYAHSVEAWRGDELAGGLYGVSLGGCFYGESMFARADNASKTAFVALAGALTDHGFALIDCQQHTTHLGSLGAIDMPRHRFLDFLEKELEKPTHQGPWDRWLPDFPWSTLWEELIA